MLNELDPLLGADQVERRIEAKDVAERLDDRRFAGPPRPDQAVEIRVEGDDRVLEESCLATTARSRAGSRTRT
jgi:hypothetical protein